MGLDVNDSEFEKEVLGSDLPVLVDFWAEWCMPCQMLTPIIAEIAKEYEGKLKVCKVNVDKSPKTASEYGIRSIPTLIVFKGGKVVDTFMGALPKNALEESLKPHIA